MLLLFWIWNTKITVSLCFSVSHGILNNNWFSNLRVLGHNKRLRAGRKWMQNKEGGWACSDLKVINKMFNQRGSRHNLSRTGVMYSLSGVVGELMLHFASPVNEKLLHCLGKHTPVTPVHKKLNMQNARTGMNFWQNHQLELKYHSLTVS